MTVYEIHELSVAMMCDVGSSVREPNLIDSRDVNTGSFSKPDFGC